VDAVVIRSVTRVDPSLLDGSSVRFVGTTSIGMDHLDVPYLARRGIHYSNAAGCNAESVAEYMAAGLLETATSQDWELTEKSLAIVGVGNIGSRVERVARAMGMTVYLCDPPLRESTGDPRYIALDDVLGADIITLHVPLTREGPHPTYHMIDRDVLERLSPHQFLINTSRGQVVNGVDLKQAVGEGEIGGAILDVWEGEPEVDYGLLDLMMLGTPHIAGFSLDGKVRATEMILHALCRFSGLPIPWDSTSVLPDPVHLRPPPGSHGQSAIRSLVRQAYDVRRDDEDLRHSRDLRPDEAAGRFDELRAQYALRPEFRHYTVELPDSCAEIAEPLRDLGFRILQTGNKDHANG